MSGNKSYCAVDSVEITPGMIKAGVDEFFGFDMRFDPPAFAVERIFRAMLRASVEVGGAPHVSGKVTCVHRTHRKEHRKGAREVGHKQMKDIAPKRPKLQREQPIKRGPKR